MTKFVGLRVKTYSYLIDDSNEDKNMINVSKKKQQLKFENYKNCLEATYGMIAVMVVYWKVVCKTHHHNF